MLHSALVLEVNPTGLLHEIQEESLVAEANSDIIEVLRASGNIRTEN